MDIIYENNRDEGYEVKLKNIEAIESHRVPPQPLPSSSAASPPSPPSSSSSPSHEFTFTISLQPSTQRTPPSFALDLSPADDIFFHGHLLPLHLLSQLPLSPRSSTNELDGFTLPAKDSTQDKNLNPLVMNNTINGGQNLHDHHLETKTRTKSKSFSIFGLSKRRKNCDEKEEHDKNKTKLRFDVSHVLKKYLRMVRPLLSFRSSRRREENMHFQRQAYSFSGNTSFRDHNEKIRGKRIQYSAPASMRTSPHNSGPLVGTSTPSSTTDSTMEELQAAIQAAIAHCKNSSSVEDKKNKTIMSHNT